MTPKCFCALACVLKCCGVVINALELAVDVTRDAFIRHARTFVGGLLFVVMFVKHHVLRCVPLVRENVTTNVLTADVRNYVENHVHPA